MDASASYVVKSGTNWPIVRCLGHTRPSVSCLVTFELEISYRVSKRDNMRKSSIANNSKCDIVTDCNLAIRVATTRNKHIDDVIYPPILLAVKPMHFDNVVVSRSKLN